MANAILEAIRGSSTEDKREALAALERDLYGTPDDARAGDPDPFVYDDAGNVMLNEHGFPIFTAAMEAELERRSHEPRGKGLTVEEFIAELEADLDKRK